MKFFRENIGKLKNENEEHMLIGFEVAFPSLLDIARSLKIEVENDSPILKDIFVKRDEKLTRYNNYACLSCLSLPISIFINKSYLTNFIYKSLFIYL